MNLENYIKRQRPESLVKIGTASGSGFVYAGSCGSLNLKALSQEWVGYLRRLQERSQVNKKAAARARKLVDGFVPFEQWEVVKEYPSQLEPCMIVIVSGKEAGKRFAVDETPRPLKITGETQMERLASSVYFYCTQEMSVFYKRYTKAREELLEWQEETTRAAELIALSEMFRPVAVYHDCVAGIYSEAVAVMRNAMHDVREAKAGFQTRADWICGDEYGILDDPVAVVEAVMKAGDGNRRRKWAE